ncbi:MAG: hypothetical protein D4R43_02725 [Sphingobacteriales bacterium]|nr:MAG: hypothetical protein D4R43_02725 [Sphingobacteriales bacterium]
MNARKPAGENTMQGREWGNTNKLKKNIEGKARQHFFVIKKMVARPNETCCATLSYFRLPIEIGINSRKKIT